MVISRLHRPLSLTLATLGLISLVACGGGGGSGGGGKSSSSTPPVVIDDTTPNAISFAATEGAEPNAVITSPAVTITGINTATPISISGGEYSIAGGAFTSTAGTITNGQTLTVRLTASDKTNTAKAVTVTVGGVSATFSVTTVADTTADAFSFTAVTGAELNKEYTSVAVTISGIDVAVPVSITGGLYSINGGEFTSAAGSVSAGQTITVKATSGNSSETTQNAVLSVGSISGTFAVTTIPDTTPPVAEFKFPTPYTMSEANSVKVRGTATDDHAITSVKVVVRSYNLDAPTVTLSTETIDVTPKATGDYSSWTADIPLTALAENEVKVIATDDRENETLLADANKVVIRQANVASAFPDEVNQFVWLPGSIAIDKTADRNRVLASDHDPEVIYAVDLDAGTRSRFIEIKNDDCSNHAEGIILDAANNKLYVSCNVQPKTKLLEYNLVSGELENTYATSSDAYVYAMALDRNNGRNQLVFATYTFSENVWEEDQGGVYAFDLDKKVFSTISEKINQQIPIVEAKHIVVDGNRYLVNSGGILEGADTRKLIAVDALTGVRNVVSSNAMGAGELFRGPSPDISIQILGLYVQPQKNRALVVEYGGKIFSVDLTTGDRSVFKDISYGQADGEDSVYTQDIEVDLANDIAYIDDDNRNAILILDLETQEKLILSKSKNNF